MRISSGGYPITGGCCGSRSGRRKRKKKRRRNRRKNRGQREKIEDRGKKNPRDMEAKSHIPGNLFGGSVSWSSILHEKTGIFTIFRRLKLYLFWNIHPRTGLD